MNEAPTKSTLADWFATTTERAQASSRKPQGAAIQLGERFASLALRLEATAGTVDATRASLDLKPLPPIDIEGAVYRLQTHGAEALTMREKRGLASQPSLVPSVHVARLLEAQPSLARHLVRACLSDWRSFCTAPWGNDFTPLLLRHAGDSGLALFRGELGTPKELIRRTDPQGTAVVAEALVGAPIERAHDYLCQTLGLRNAWLYTAEALAVWLRRRNVHGLPLDEAFQGVRTTPALRTMLLPAVTGEATATGVRIDEGVHGLAVAALLDGAYRSPPSLSPASLSELSSLLMRSTFGDPRLPPLSAGWTNVREHAEVSFRRFMTSLAEQDLEVFFTHAMRENDRRLFWLSYLPQIERTGCVLDSGLRESLYNRVSGDENLRAAVKRTHRFRRSSSTQAFYLVFPQHVVIEFSTTGHAAYVYRRDLFENEIERTVQRRAVESVADLKLKDKARVEYKIRHAGSWQSKTAQWLSEQGIHSKRRW
ncbi:MAG: hypothetical protein RLZZ450_5397 [Pseudomonadota bacterium]